MKVVITDREDYVELLDHNIKLNEEILRCQNVSALPLDWGNLEQVETNKAPDDRYKMLNLTLQIREVLKSCKQQRAEGLVDILLVSDCVFYKVLQVHGLAGLLIDRLISGIN